MVIKDSTSYYLIHFANELRTKLEQLMLEIGLHSGQAMIMESLWEKNCQSQADLVRSLSVTPPTVYNMVVRLVKAEFVETKKLDTDARIVLVCLTQKGIELQPLFRERWAKLEHQMLANLNETEAMMFSLLLKKLKPSEEFR